VSGHDLAADAFEVRGVTDADLGQIVRLHARVFPDAALTALGPEALRRYYRWQLDGPHEVDAVGVFAGDVLVGLLVGGRFQGSMIGFVKLHAPFLVARTLRHPTVLLGGRGRSAIGTGLRLLARPVARTEVERPERVPDRSFGVLVVAVDPDAQRGGVGRVLLVEAERCAHERGLTRLHLTLDPTNWGAAAFYRELGWRRLGLEGDTDRSWLIGKELSSAGGAGPPSIG
jgi:ribosomal protein S18 acetylase RimI-like enzyme